MDVATPFGEHEPPPPPPPWIRDKAGGLRTAVALALLLVAHCFQRTAPWCEWASGCFVQLLRSCVVFCEFVRKMNQPDANSTHYAMYCYVRLKSETGRSRLIPNLQIWTTDSTALTFRPVPPQSMRTAVQSWPSRRLAISCPEKQAHSKISKKLARSFCCNFLNP